MGQIEILENKMQPVKIRLLENSYLKSLTNGKNNSSKTIGGICKQMIWRRKVVTDFPKTRTSTVNLRNFYGLNFGTLNRFAMKSVDMNGAFTQNRITLFLPFWIRFRGQRMLRKVREGDSIL